MKIQDALRNTDALNIKQNEVKNGVIKAEALLVTSMAVHNLPVNIPPKCMRSRPFSVNFKRREKKEKIEALPLHSHGAGRGADLATEGQAA